VKAIAEAHHGSVRVRSTVGRGSVFEVLLPASGLVATTSPDAAVGRAAASHHPPTSHPARTSSSTPR